MPWSGQQACCRYACAAATGALKAVALALGPLGHARQLRQHIRAWADATCSVPTCGVTQLVDWRSSCRRRSLRATSSTCRLGQGSGIVAATEASVDSLVALLGGPYRTNCGATVSNWAQQSNSHTMRTSCSASPHELQLPLQPRSGNHAAGSLPSPRRQPARQPAQQVCADEAACLCPQPSPLQPLCLGRQLRRQARRDSVVVSFVQYGSSSSSAPLPATQLEPSICPATCFKRASSLTAPSPATCGSTAADRKSCFGSAASGNSRPNHPITYPTKQPGQRPGEQTRQDETRPAPRTRSSRSTAMRAWYSTWRCTLASMSCCARCARAASRAALLRGSAGWQRAEGGW